VATWCSKSGSGGESVLALDVTEAQAVAQKTREVIADEGFKPAEFSIQVVERDEPGVEGGRWFVVHVKRSGTRFAAQYSTGSELWTRLLADQLRHGYYSAAHAPPPAKGRCR
jgi:hypothetical protein